METLVNNCKLSAKDAEEERVMDSNSDNIKFTPHNDPNDAIDELPATSFKLFRKFRNMN